MSIQFVNDMIKQLEIAYDKWETFEIFRPLCLYPHTEQLPGDSVNHYARHEWVRNNLVWEFYRRIMLYA